MLFPSTSWGQAIAVFIFSIIRYAFVAGGAFSVFYVILKRKLLFYKIQQYWPSNKDYQREILYALSSFLFFAAVPMVLKLSFIKPHNHYI